MSKMVSARIPDALYEQASMQLAEMGSSPSELVNAAFEYLLQEKALPSSGRDAKASKKRVLSKEKAQALRRSLRACRLDIALPSDVGYDKQVLSEAKSEKYAALA